MLRNSPSFRSQTLVDMPLLLVVVAIASIGVINLYSATSAYVGAARASGLADIYVTQIYWLVVGFLVAMALAAIDYRYLERIAPTLYVGGIFMLCLVFLSADVRGVHRWIRLGGLTFQPSEFMKPLVVLMIARHVHNDFKTDSRTLIDLLKPLAIALLPMLLVILQPDLGTSLIYMLATITMLLITRIRGRSLLTGLFGGISAVYLMYQFGLKDYQKGRVTSRKHL